MIVKCNGKNVDLKIYQVVDQMLNQKMQHKS